MPIALPLDTSGVSPTNYVQNELHTVSEGQFRDYHFIVPIHTPFFVDNFSLKLVVNDVEQSLTEDVDFTFVLPYITGTRVTGKQLYGAITIHNLDMNGILKMSYQPVGGDQSVDQLHVLTTLAEKAYNPRTTIFDLITNLPTSWPPTPHYQDYASFYGQEELTAALLQIASAIASNASLTSTAIQNFLSEFNSGTSTSYIRKSGDTMVGPLLLGGMPTDPLQAVNKGYVDQLVSTNETLSSILSNYVTTTVLTENVALLLAKSGGIMNGPLSVIPPTELSLIHI